MSDQPKSTPFAPQDWEMLSVFRETFLYPYLSPENAESLRRIGHWLYLMALSQDGPPVETPESPLRCDLRGAARDLRHLEGFLGAVHGQLEGSSLDSAEARLALRAECFSDQVGRLALGIEELLGPEPQEKEGWPEIWTRT